MGVLVERCRYLEQSGCASICINSCKVPTQVRGEPYILLLLLMLLVLLAVPACVWRDTIRTGLQ